MDVHGGGSREQLVVAEHRREVLVLVMVLVFAGVDGRAAVRAGPTNRELHREHRPPPPELVHAPRTLPHPPVVAVVPLLARGGGGRGERGAGRSARLRRGEPLHRGDGPLRNRAHLRRRPGAVVVVVVVRRGGDRGGSGLRRLRRPQPGGSLVDDSTRDARGGVLPTLPLVLQAPQPLLHLVRFFTRRPLALFRLAASPGAERIFRA